jgi:hypothetical protein
MAAHALSRRWHRPSLFDLEAPVEECDRRRVGLQNIWRRRHGEGSVSTEGEPRRPAPQVEAVVQEAIAVPSPTARQQAIQKIEEQGLAVLPAVRHGADGLDPRHPAYAHLGRCARRLAFTVGPVTVQGGSVQMPAEIQRWLDALKGKPLEERPLVELIIAALAKLPEGYSGVELTAEREGDDTGCEITFSLEGRNGLSGDPRWGWQVRASARVGGETLWEESSRCPLDEGRSQEKWEAFASALAAALSAPLDVRVAVHVRVVHAKEAGTAL